MIDPRVLTRKKKHLFAIEQEGVFVYTMKLNCRLTELNR